MGKRGGKVRGRLHTTITFQLPPRRKLGGGDGGSRTSSTDDENIMGKRGGKVRGRLQTTKTFRPPRRKLGGSDGGSRSSSTDDDDVQQSLLLYNKDKYENEYGERQCVCLLLEDGEYDEERNDVNVFAIDIRGGGRFHKLLLLPEAKHGFRFGRGYRALASTLYRIGGANLKPTDWEPTFHATDVWYCDLSYRIDPEKKDKEKKGDFEIAEEDIVLRCHGWRRGPSTLGAKPNPLIVTARGKIYALAGSSIKGWNHMYSSGPKFEVFDPRLREWEALPDPPFAGRIYFIDGPHYWGHAVIGNLIFIKVALDPNCIGRTLLASFEMVNKLWNTYDPQETSKDAFLDNLRRCWWKHRAPIYNNKMFACYARYHGVFAHNLLLPNYRRVKTDSDDSSDDSSDDDEIDFFPIPVRGSGLEDAATIKKSGITTSGYLSHLGKNNFCMFSPYDRGANSYIRMCTFSVGDEKERQRDAADDDDETLLRAENVISQDKPITEFGIGEMVTLVYEWIRLRRRFQKDYVVGKGDVCLAEEREFFPLKIHDLLEQKSINMTELLEYGVGVNRLMEPRLSKEARLIISGMLRRLNEVHQSGWCLKKLSVDSFLVNEKYGVMLDVENLRPAKEESRIYEDYKNLKMVIKRLLEREKNPIPKDVKLFLDLLDNSVNSEESDKGSETSEGEGNKIETHGSNGMRLALHHICLWSPMVMIKRIIPIAKLLLSYGILSKRTCQSVGFITSIVNWRKMIPRDSIYEKLLNNSSDSHLFSLNIFGLVVYIRDAFSHANEYATTGRECRTLEEIEKNVFVIFANILKKLTKVLSLVDPLKFIFKSKEDDDDLVI